ncbi:hypothetical protein B5D82_01220 [Cognaticolwellia beringensis]|uniref:Uncharacterized protein n=1 Tax=Cognaticolwellia beringensis TaxID=1967665 RepID=A0A222G567_9GAMM|nr:hypothetical protein B5D82_01220 [Cognaticolwellia beringensis]
MHLRESNKSNCAFFPTNSLIKLTRTLTKVTPSLLILTIKNEQLINQLGISGYFLAYSFEAIVTK